MGKAKAVAAMAMAKKRGVIGENLGNDGNNRSGKPVFV